MSLQTISGGEEMYYSIFDLLIKATKESKRTSDDLYFFFRKKGIKKAELIELKSKGSFDCRKELKDAILEYLGMTELEVWLSLGMIPLEYRKSYIEHIPDIVNILEPPKKKITEKELIPFYKTGYGKLYNCDCMQLLGKMKDESVDLIFADPPFNLNKEYGEGISDDLFTTAYVNWCYEWIDECIRILKPGGTFMVYNLPKWSMYYAEYLNRKLTFRSWITIDMKYSLPINGRLSPSHYTLLYYVKGNRPNVFNNPRIPLQTCRHCGGELKDYGGYKDKMNPNGVNVSDVWYDIYPVRHSKNRKNNELSVKLLERIISMTTNENDIVFDPFGGSGTTYAVAELLKRNWSGSEIGDCEVIKNRLINSENDRKLLGKVYSEKNVLFTEVVKKIRRKNGFWLPEDFQR